MAFTTVAAGQPIRSTHINQFSQWITAGRKDISATITSTSASEYTATFTNEDTSAGLIAKFVYGATTVGLINKTGATFSVPIIATGVLAGLFSATGQIIYGSGGTAATTLAIGSAFQALTVNAGTTAPQWSASLQSLMASAGSLVVASGANTPAHLGRGTSFQEFVMNGGGTGQTWATGFLASVQAAGDIIYGSGANAAGRLAAGANGQVLSLASGVPVWAAAATAAQSLQTPILNGDFSRWPDGTSFASAASLVYPADGWRYQVSLGTGVVDINQSTDVPSVATTVPLQNYSLHIDCKTTEAAVAAGELCVIDQTIEGQYFLPFAQRAFTLSFWVKATKTGTYCVGFRNSGADRSYVAEYTVSSSATWEQKSISVPASPSAGTWDYGTGVGLRIFFPIVAGTSVWLTAGAWTSASGFATANQVNGLDSASNDWRLAQVQIDLGTTASAFAPLRPDETTAWAQRYYRVRGGGGTFERMGMGQVNTSTSGSMPFTFPDMRTAPTITVSSAANFALADVTGGAVALSAFTTSQVTPSSANFVLTVASGLTAGQATYLMANNSTAARLMFNARY